MHILAFETSCDETAVATIAASLKTGHFKILSNIISSQIKLHAKWGGVVPNLAAREHLKNILPVAKTALKEAQTKLNAIDLITVTQGPGLIPALLVGANFAKALSYFSAKPLLGIHHLEGHLTAALIQSHQGRLANLKFPVLALIVSGGHTQLVLMKKWLDYQIVGQTQDDAAGEAFDKVAKLLNLGYPGGPIVSQKAAEVETTINNTKKQSPLSFLLEKISFPRPMLQSKDLNFSFSGLKTAVLYFYQNLNSANLTNQQLTQWKKVICYEFQQAVVEVLIQKTLRAVKQFSPKTVILAGGVAANQSLRQNLQTTLREKAPSVNFLLPPLEFCGDNAAMIGVAAFARFSLQQKNKKFFRQINNNWKTLEADPNLPL